MKTRFKAPNGWVKTRQDEGEKTYKNKDGRTIVVSESWRGKPSYRVTWEIEKTSDFEDWKRKEFPMNEKGQNDLEKFITDVMNS